MDLFAFWLILLLFFSFHLNAFAKHSEWIQTNLPCLTVNGHQENIEWKNYQEKASLLEDCVDHISWSSFAAYGQAIVFFLLLMKSHLFPTAEKKIVPLCMEPPLLFLGLRNHMCGGYWALISGTGLGGSYLAWEYYRVVVCHMWSVHHSQFWSLLLGCSTVAPHSVKHWVPHEATGWGKVFIFCIACT